MAAVANTVVEMAERVFPFVSALALCVVVEMLLPRGTRYRLRDRLPGLWFILALPLFAYAMQPGIDMLARLSGIRPLLGVSALPMAIAMVIAVVLIDFLSYWEHRFEHRFWWSIHAVHHASKEVHSANNYGHVFQYFGEVVCISVPLCFLGFQAVEIPMAVTVYRSFHSMLNHAPTTFHLGPLRRVFCGLSLSTASHHSLEHQHFNKNFGTILSVWDQLFGTAYFPAKDEWPATGVAGLEPPRTLGEYLLYPIQLLRADSSGQPTNL